MRVFGQGKRTECITEQNRERKEEANMILRGNCEHCGSGWIESDKDYIWHCRKCGRYEARPYKEDPLLNKITGRQIDIEMENRMCQDQKCEKTFQARPGSHKVFCSTCQGIYDARAWRKRMKEGKGEVRI
jgi:ribosomal protein L37AE/L43A